MKIQSNNIIFMDVTDTRKVDIHISSNHPTVQIFDSNTNESSRTPDWSVEPLELIPAVYADSTNVTDSLSSFRWTKIIGEEEIILTSTNKVLTIIDNQLDETIPMIRYKFYAYYNNTEFSNEIVFSLITAGKNGTDGYTPQKGVDYFDGKNGEPGKSVGIKGVAYTNESFVAGAPVTLYSVPELGEQNKITIGGDIDTVDGYLVDGYLCVYTGEYFIWTGKIQGPQGQKGESTYLFTRYADDQNGSGFSVSPIGKKYIGFYRHSENTLPSTISIGYDTWTWVKYVGDDAKSISLNATTQVFRVDKEGNVSPSTLTITSQATNTSITKWEYNTNGGTFSTTPPSGVVRGSDGKITVTGASMTANSIAIRMGDGTYSDTLTIYKVYDGDKGEDAPIVFLTNENITFAANSNGQVAGITVDCDVVAYTGTTKVTPTVGVISSVDLPDGMSLGEISTEDNQVQIPIIIADNATLGSAQNINGTIKIPILSPVITDLYLTWSKVNSGAKGEAGVGISSVTVTYGVSTSASTQPTSWQSSVPTVADGSYLWTRTITDYTDSTIPDTVTYTYAKQGVKGDTGSTGSSVTVSKIEYQSGTSATIAPTSTWSNSVVSVAEGNYLWTKTTFSDNKVAYGVAKQGQKGDQGIQGIQGPKGNDAYTVMLTNESHIFAGDISNAIAGTAETQVLAYNGSTAQTVTIVSVNGKTAATADTDTGIAGLKFKCSALSSTSPKITFTCTTAFVNKSGFIPIVLSVGGVQFTKMFTYSIAFKGATGAQGGTGTPASLVDITPSALYFKSTTGKDGTFTPDYIYLYPRFQTVTFSKWEYSVNGGTTWVAASGANGLTISTYNSVANTLRIAKTSTLYTDAVTSISFRCVSSNASVYDTVSIAKIYDVVDLQIGGRNLLLNTSFDGGLNKIYNLPSSITSGEGGLTFNLSESLPSGTEVALRFQIRGLANVNVYWMMTGGNVAQTVITKNNISATEFSTIEARYTVPTGKTLNSVFICTAYGNSVAGTDWFEIKTKSLQLELGNTFTDWSPAPEDLISTTFQLYTPKGSLITKDVPEVTLETFAYDGSQSITGATFEWYSLIDDVWTVISGASGTSLTLNKNSVLKSNVYKCKMTYKGKTYEATATVEDKTDIYESIMCISSNARGNDCYWVLYTLVYTDAEEVDPLLGPISINAPDSPVNGDYWYAVDESNASVQLKKYNGTAWVNSTDTQSLSYYWDIVNNGSEKVPFGDHSKVQVVSCNDFTSTATLVCGVNNVEDGLLTQSSLSLTDASDPIVSTTEPSSVIDGQIWIKPNNNGTYIMSIWDDTNGIWVVSDMDTRTKVYTSKPSAYNVGDLWITASDTEHSGYLEGTLLMASTSSSTFSESHWSTTLKYDKDLDLINKTLNDLSQYVNITSEGLKIGAQSVSGEISPFTSLFTSTELAFYQNSDKLLTLSNNQLIAPHIVVEDDLEVGKTISLGNLNLTIETNGSFSFTVTK